MNIPLDTLEGRSFDVAVIGAGVVGGGAVQHLTAAGYNVLLVDKGDFASGSSSRSSRLLHCGLRYLAPGKSMWEFILHPTRFMTALRMARQAMECRAQFARMTPERVRQLTFCFPMYKGGPYAPWQVDAAFHILKALGPKDVPLDYKRITPDQVRDTPLLEYLRDPDQLIGAAQFREYQFEWPERIVMDAVLHAEQAGATVRNYTEAARLEQNPDKSWQILLRDAHKPDATAKVSAKIVLNMAGIWIDDVNAKAQKPVSRKITGTKGVHIMVQLPPHCRDHGIATLNRLREGFYCVPWRGMHYFGPTETLYEGNIDDIRPEDEDIDFLLGEANHLLPKLKLKRSDVLFSWAGVRPLTYDPALPMGNRSRELHDLASEGLENAFAMTAGPIMTHRNAGQEVVETVRRKIQPSRAPRPIDYSARLPPDNQNSPPLLDDYPAIKMSDLRFSAENEHVSGLVDLLFRRVGAGWTAGMSARQAEAAAMHVADLMGWDEARAREEAARYRDHLARQHRIRPQAAE